MKGLEFKTFPFEVKAGAGDGDGAHLEGLVACFLSIDDGGDMFVPGCFADYLPFFKSEGVIRDEHCVTTGKITDAAERGTEGLWFAGEILPTSAGKDQSILVKGKAVTRLSVGSRNWGRWVDDPEEIKALWSAHGYAPTDDDLMRVGFGVRVIERSKPYEASTTWLPMNKNTQITSVKSDGPPARPTFDQHSGQVLAAVAEFTGRAESLAALRAEKGRGLSAKSRARVAQLLERLGKLALTPETKADVTEAPAPETDPNTLYAEYLATCARLDGNAA